MNVDNSAMVNGWQRISNMRAISGSIANTLLKVAQMDQQREMFDEKLAQAQIEFQAQQEQESQEHLLNLKKAAQRQQQIDAMLAEMSDTKNREERDRNYRKKYGTSLAQMGWGPRTKAPDPGRQRTAEHLAETGDKAAYQQLLQTSTPEPITPYQERSLLERLKDRQSQDQGRMFQAGKWMRDNAVKANATKVRKRLTAAFEAKKSPAELRQIVLDGGDQIPGDVWDYLRDLVAKTEERMANAEAAELAPGRMKAPKDRVATLIDKMDKATPAGRKVIGAELTKAVGDLKSSRAVMGTIMAFMRQAEGGTFKTEKQFASHIMRKYGKRLKAELGQYANDPDKLKHAIKQELYTIITKQSGPKWLRDMGEGGKPYIEYIKAKPEVIYDALEGVADAMMKMGR